MSPKLPEKKTPKWVRLNTKSSFSKFKKEKHKSKNESFYSSKAWKDLRAFYFKTYPLCQWCKEEGNIVEGKEVDHIKEIEDGGDKLDYNNLMTLCTRHHRQKTSWARAKRKKEKNIQNNLAKGGH